MCVNRAVLINLCFVLALISPRGATELLALPSPPPLERVPNTTLSFPPAPPQQGYTVPVAFTGITFNQPVCITSPPGETNRLFILEKPGNIYVITNLAKPTRTLFMHVDVLFDSESGLLGMAFHPGYATNGLFYLSTTRPATTTQGSGRHQRFSSYRTSSSNPNQGDPASEVILISQYDTAGNHQGSDIHFGRDGYLYISLGDEGPQYDAANNSQTITKNFFSGILRIDVDGRPGNLPPNPHPANTTNYFIPADNPFVGISEFNHQPVDPNKVRTEFYAVGFRNPWRMSFDPVTDDLYVGDVGQDKYEEVDLVVKGGNYGWSYQEGLHPGPKVAPTALDLIPPIHEYSHGSGPVQGNSIIGGIMYRGKRISQLYGSYVFADYTSGNVWAIQPAGQKVVPSQRLTGVSSPAAFGRDPRNGDILIAELGGQIRRLDYSAFATGQPLPSSLADTGAFKDLATLEVNPGIVSYEPNVTFWSDGALKQRWFSIPDTNATIGFKATENWTFPPGSVWIKHFELELTNGVPSSRRRLETRFLIRGSNDVYGVTYRWDATQTNALLVREAGVDQSFVVWNQGTSRTQTWHFPSRAECLMCHTRVSGSVLAFNTAQLNKEVTDHGVSFNQIEALGNAGYFSSPIGAIHTLPALISLTNVEASVESRARSYLAANCSQCHQPGGPTPALFDARYSTRTADAGLVGGALNGSGSLDGNKVISPGRLDRSEMLSRISVRGGKQMPPVGSNVVDTNAIALLTEWIQGEATTFLTFPSWQTNYFSSTNAPEANPTSDPDNDGSSNELEFLLFTDPLTPSPAWTTSVTVTPDAVSLTFPRVAGRGFEVQWSTNLVDSSAWQPVNVPGNAPFFSISNTVSTVSDPAPDRASRFYRVRVYDR